MKEDSLKTATPLDLGLTVAEISAYLGFLRRQIYRIRNNGLESRKKKNWSIPAIPGTKCRVWLAGITIEIDCPGAGAGFLALISEGISRAIRGEKNFLKQTTCKRLPIKPTPPQRQSYEDKRIMVRLNPDHEARKNEPFLLRQQIQHVAILAPTLSKAAAILQYNEVIAQRFGIAVVERQESWKKSVIGPLPKQISTMGGSQDPSKGLLLQEPGFAPIYDETKRSKESSEPLGHIRFNVPETKAHRFFSKLPLFEAAVGIPKIRERKTAVNNLATAMSEHVPAYLAVGFALRKVTKYERTSCDLSRDHNFPPKCAYCRGPHTADSLECLIRPNKDNKLPSKAQISEIKKVPATARLRLKVAHCENIKTATLADNKPSEACTETSSNIRTLFPSLPSSLAGI
ncbi:hypothetical protein EPUL_002457 [Erysiphe pulchra]|uniref:Uncharacterized protein n=1 Tax=Erysiphe pulchra TaxID=225359 RepID=A0A2S4PTX8_9PEZI|nr:hypothetical protein EPUL_002457 [Erysiphe pulchra]